MVTGYETITYELSEAEMKLVPIVVKGMKRYTGKSNAIKGPAICAGLKCTEARLRKVVNYIRTKGLAPIMATSQGYYLSNDRTEIQTQIKSLQERANGILAAANGLKKFID